MKTRDLAIRPENVAEKDLTIAAVMSATDAAFNPRGDSFPLRTDCVKVCAALIDFLKFAEAAPPRSFAEWREAIENLNFGLGEESNR